MNSGPTRRTVEVILRVTRAEYRAWEREATRRRMRLRPFVREAVAVRMSEGRTEKRVLGADG